MWPGDQNLISGKQNTYLDPQVLCTTNRYTKHTQNLTDPFHLITGIENNWRQDDIKEYLRIKCSLQTQNNFIIRECNTVYIVNHK